MSNQLVTVSTLNKYFTNHKGQLAAALPKHITPDRMIRLALTSFSTNPKLAECTPESVFASVIVASQLGLEPGISGQGYLVPYKNKCTFIPGWQGYIDLVSRTGRASAWTGAVFEGDEFDYQLGSNPFVHHKPQGEFNPLRLRYVYSIGYVKNSEWPIIEVWNMDRIWSHRDANNKVGELHYSYKHPEMYARKVPLLQVIKYLPKSIEVANAMEVDLAASKGHRAEFINGEFQIIEDEPEDPTQPKTSDIGKKPNETPEPEPTAEGIFGGNK